MTTQALHHWIWKRDHFGLKKGLTTIIELFHIKVGLNCCTFNESKILIILQTKNWKNNVTPDEISIIAYLNRNTGYRNFWEIALGVACIYFSLFMFLCIFEEVNGPFYILFGSFIASSTGESWVYFKYPWTTVFYEEYSSYKNSNLYLTCLYLFLPFIFYKN